MSGNGDDCSHYSCNHYQYKSAVDIPLGTIFIICAVFGVPANLTACYYFVRKGKGRQSRNSEFFNTVYAIISAVGCSICICQIPMIDVLVKGRRSQSLVFHNQIVCHGWYVVWMVLTQMNIFLVAELSTSRLLLIAKSSRKLAPLAAWLLPLLFGISALLVMYVVPMVTGRSTVTYNKEHAMCLIKAKNDSVEWSQTSSQEQVEFVQVGTVLLMLFTLALGFPILPVCVSCILSLIYLHKAEKTARSVQGSVAAQRRSSVTVVVFTTVYIVFNIPLFVRIVGTAVYNGQLFSLIQQGGGVEEIKAHISKFYSYEDVSMHYALLLVWGLSTVLNVAVNPLVLYWRMEPFRKFLNNKVDNDSSLLSGLSTKMSVISNFGRRVSGMASPQLDKDSPQSNPGPGDISAQRSPASL